MTESNSSGPIACRRFDEADQARFADWSGDRNPMHLDAVAARRTHAGAPVVYGILLLVWALDEIYRIVPESRTLRLMRVDFKRYVHVGQDVSLTARQTAKGLTAEILSGSDPAVTIKLSAGVAKASSLSNEDLAVVPHSEFPIELRIGEMSGSRGWLASASPGMAAAFPTAAEVLSAAAIDSMGQLSRLVGMVCPGLHSVFSSLDLSVCETESDRPGIGFATRSADPRFNLVTVDVAGSGLVGSVAAFVRPEPVQSASMENLANVVSTDQFEGRVALIVGGSRGLGAVTAKLIAAGGGRVAITYAMGKDDANSVVEEINRSRPDAASAIRLDVTQDIATQLGSLEVTPTHVYYYATPQIFLQKSPAYDARVFHRFLAYYVDGLNNLCLFLAARTIGNIVVFYPSSSAVEDRPKGMMEYAMAKAAGELMCDDLGKQLRQLKFVKHRIGRTLTDQTATISPSESADAVSVLLPLLND